MGEFFFKQWTSQFRKKPLICVFKGLNLESLPWFWFLFDRLYTNRPTISSCADPLHVHVDFPQHWGISVCQYIKMIKVTCCLLLRHASSLHQREKHTAVNMCSSHWTIGHLSACPNCACWQWLGLAVGLVLSDTVERPGFHSTSCLAALQWKYPVMWPVGLPQL